MIISPGPDLPFRRLGSPSWGPPWVCGPCLTTGRRDTLARHCGVFVFIPGGGDEVLATTFINHGGAPAVPRAPVGFNSRSNKLSVNGRKGPPTHTKKTTFASTHTSSHNIMHGPLRRWRGCCIFKTTINIYTFAAQRCKILPVVHDWWQMGSVLQTQTTLLPARCNYRTD